MTDATEFVMDAAVADIAALERLSQMAPLDYERARIEEASKLGVRAPVLDKLVAERRVEPAADGAGRPLEWPTPEPWPEPVDGAALLDDLATTFGNYVVLPPGCDAALALWSLQAHAFEASPITPRLAITSPEKRCGKTTTLEVVQGIVPRPILASNITAAAVFRTIEQARPTLLIDEADTFFAEAEELRGILNSGHRRSGEVIRTVGDDHEPRRFSTWAPVAIAAIGKIPGTLDDRSIKVELRRRGAGERVDRWRADRADQLEPLVRRCARWSADHLEALRHADPTVPAQLHDRAADNWRPLLALADLAGGDWPARARAVAVALAAGTDAQGKSEMLLADVRSVFAERDDPEWNKTEEIIKALIDMAERPWAESSRGKPISQQGLRSLLEPFKVFSTQKQKDGDRGRGYALAAFADAWARYLPSDASVHPCTDQQSQGIEPNHDPCTPQSSARMRNGPKPSNGAARARMHGSYPPELDGEAAPVDREPIEVRL